MPSPENANPVCYDLWTNSIFEGAVTGANGSTDHDHGGGRTRTGTSSAVSERAPVTAPLPTTTREKKKGWFSK